MNYVRQFGLSMAFVIGILLLPFASVYAVERIPSFDSVVTIQEDGSLQVEEVIEYDFDANQRHGIFRTIPSTYKNTYGSFTIDIDNIAVVDEKDRTRPFTVSRRGGEVEIKIGNPDVTISGVHTYQISYTVRRAMAYKEDRDWLFWNATGNEWNVAIDRATATIVFPQPLERTRFEQNCFAGPYGSRNICSRSEYIGVLAADGLAREENVIEAMTFSDGLLAAGNGLSVEVGLPKGEVVQPSILTQLWYLLRDNWIYGLPFITFGVMFYLWFTVGRDPEKTGARIAWYEPPDKLTPAEVGTIVDEWTQPKDVTSTIIDLAVRGFLKIHSEKEKGLIKTKDSFYLEKLNDPDTTLTTFEHELFHDLFESKRVVTLESLKNKFYETTDSVTKKIYERVTKNGYFPKNPKSVRNFYLTIGIAVLIGSFVLNAIFFQYFFALASGMLSGTIVIVFSFIMPRKTRKGFKAKEHILGFKDYLSIAEGDRIRFHNAPEKNPELFEKFLPYAIVLGVEEKWAGKFRDIYEKKQPSWYDGSRTGALSVAQSLRSFETSAASTVSSRPSSSGGSGGGGFSGGGVGGGGGGSW